jgi:transcriptional regulator with XRE-family HTH domain
MTFEARRTWFADWGMRMTHSGSATKNGNAKPSPIDAHVGNRIRLRRVTLGLPMTEVAKNLGVSWQQLGKYEQARDRTSASMLYLIASALGVPVDFFFADLQLDETNENKVERLQASAIGEVLTLDARGQHIDQFIASYWRIEDAKQRRHILRLVKSLAGQAKAPKLDRKPRPDPI